MGISSVLGSSALLPGGLGFRNLIMNGDMRINQRGFTSSVGFSSYPYDRWVFNYSAVATVTAATSTDVPTGSPFAGSILLTNGSSSSGLAAATCWIEQRIEGSNCRSLGWGTSEAKPIVVSFWVKSSVTGSFGVSILGGAVSAERGYATTYTVNAANTWERKVVSIPGDISGTWEYGNAKGVTLRFYLDRNPTNDGQANVWRSTTTASTSHTNFLDTASATFRLTGVQLEQNYQDTPFELRPIGLEEILCRRYYQIWSNTSNTNFMSIGNQIYSNPISLSVPMRPLTTTSTTYVATIYAQSTSYSINSLAVTVFDASRPHYFTLSGTFSGSWNYSWPLCTFNAHTCTFDSEFS